MKKHFAKYYRKYIQLITAILMNAHLTGFFNGKIYQGNLKGICTPGLNCYSCPAAVTACPLGSLQNSLANSKEKVPYLLLGTLLLFGVLFGRLICGFLCPFGFLQELLHKIPTPKIKKSRFTSVLKYLKYVVLVIFVIVIPLKVCEPAFCKYICPQGTLEGGIFMAITNESLRDTLGFLFSWKVIVMALILVLCIFCYRAFCRFICPLGAIYSFFAGSSVVRLCVDESKCNNCGACIEKCQVDTKTVGDMECTYCMKCVQNCHAGAIGICHARHKNVDKATKN